METVTVEDLIEKAIREGSVIQGINDPETVKDLAEADQSIAEGRMYTHEEVKSLIDRWATE